MTAWRLLIGAAGVVTGLVGARALLDEGLDGVTEAAWWLAAGVVLHDAIWAPLTIAAGVVLVPLLPRWLRPAAVGAGIVLATVTVMAIPVLGRFGALPDNPTLLDRDYRAGWLVFAGCVVVTAVTWAVLVTRRRLRSAP